MNLVNLIQGTHAMPKWRVGLSTCLGISFVVFCFNLAFTTWAAIRLEEDENRQRAIYSGNCKKAQDLNKWLHTLINILSTAILATNNYGMQILCAPSRADIDQAHAKQSWLDVGVRSMKNVASLPPLKLGICLLFLLITLPLHLFFNSVIFYSVAAHDYYVYSVNDAFFRTPQQASWTMRTSGTLYNGRNGTREMDALERKLGEQFLELQASSAIQVLDPSACVDAYLVQFQTSHGNLLLQSKNLSVYWWPRTVTNFYDEEPAVHEESFRDVVQFTHLNQDRDQAPWLLDDWTGLRSEGREKVVLDDSFLRQPPEGLQAPFGNWVGRCLSEKVEEKCGLVFNLDLAILVVALNFTNTILLMYILFSSKHRPLLTLGDAIASFLERPDQNTADMCLRGYSDFQDAQWPREAVQFHKRQIRSFHVMSIWRWLGFGIWCVAFVTVCIVAFAVCIPYTKLENDFRPRIGGTLDYALGLGFGKIQLETLISYASVATFDTVAVARAALVVNLPQLCLSLTHYIANNVLTRMLTEREWHQYAHKRSGLRVSFAKKGQQRSSYFLQVPYRYGLPFMAVFATLHWLLSESVFLVAIQNFGYLDKDVYADADPLSITRKHLSEQDFITVGYSPLAILLTIIIIVCFLAVFLIQMFWSLGDSMPVMGNCSAVIAAGCHVDTKDTKVDIAEGEVQWGVVSMSLEGMGHCGFWSNEVEVPEEDVLYAGASRTRTG